MRIVLVVTTVHERTQREHTSGTGAQHHALTLMHVRARGSERDGAFFQPVGMRVRVGWHTLEWVPGVALLASFMRRTASPASLTCTSSSETSNILLSDTRAEFVESRRTRPMVKLYVHYELEEPEFTLPVRLRVHAAPRAGNPPPFETRVQFRHGQRIP
jgi:hypothetical protein